MPTAISTARAAAAAAAFIAFAPQALAQGADLAPREVPAHVLPCQARSAPKCRS